MLHILERVAELPEWRLFFLHGSSTGSSCKIGKPMEVSGSGDGVTVHAVDRIENLFELGYGG